MKIVTKRVGIGGVLYWVAEYDCGSQGFGKTEVEAIRNLINEFPDDGARTVVDDLGSPPPVRSKES